MNFNRKFIPNVWEAPPQVHPGPPFVNNQQNFFPNQGNRDVWNQRNSNFNQNFQHNHQNSNQNNNIRPLLSLLNAATSDHPSNFRKFNNNKSNNQEYRRPGPACSRNNYSNNSSRWNKDNRRGDFKNRESRSDNYEIQNSNFNSINLNNSNNNNRLPSYNDYNDHASSEGNEVAAPKYNSLVEHLKAVQNSKPNSSQDRSKSDIDAICVKNASGASKKLLTQLKTMDKDGVKDLVNNPKQPYKKKVLNLQAREKLRQQMREKLKRLGNEGDSLDYQLEPDECIDYEKLPETFIAQIGRTLDMGVESDDMDLSESINEYAEDKDIEVVTKNLGNDFLMGSEMLLMNGFSLLAETENDADADLPPLPSEPHSKPPSPPPEPLPSPVKPPEEKPVFSSLEKPWSPLPNNTRPLKNDLTKRFDGGWDIESAKNPDPPTETALKEQVTLKSSPQPVPSPVPPAIVVKEEKTAQSNEVAEKKTPFDEVKKTPAPEGDECNASSSASKPSNEETVEPQVESGKRANETYGDYRRRLAAERDQVETENNSNSNNSRPHSQTGFNQNQNHQNQQKGNNRKDNERSGRGGANGRRDNWLTNNRQNNRNDSNQQNRKSRFDMDRGRDRNNFQQRNLSRDTNQSFDSGRQDKAFDDVKDVHNYRFQNDRNSQEPPIERLNTILNPKPLQFKGSFNKRSHTTGHFNRRSRSRDQTPTNNSVDGDFDESLLPPLNDVRPCLTTLKKVMDIDAEMNRIHDKIHGIDKVISNLQSERISHQKIFTRLQHNRKVLFDNLMKRATSNVDREKTETPPKASAPSPVPDATPSTSQKSVMEKKLQNIVEQKKRKHDEHLEEPNKKKQAVEETTSAAAKAAQLQREREEEQRRQKNLEKKRLKKLRKERERAEKERLEERIRQEPITIIKVEQRDKSVDRTKNNKHQNHHPAKSQKAEKPKGQKMILFKESDILPNENRKILECIINLKTVPLSDDLKEKFTSSGCLLIDIEDWNKLNEPKKEEKIEADEPVKAKTPEIVEDPLAIPEYNDDPLAMDEISINPPTPGSNITPNDIDDDSILVELPTEQDYSEWTGNFTCHDQPIVHLQNISGKFVVCATESGKVYKYHLSSGKIAGVFSKHTKICNSFLYDGQGSVYTISSDGFLYKIKFKSFQLVASENFEEELQVIEKSKAGIFVGTKSGRIFRINADLSQRKQEPICNLGFLILCMRASKEGSRNILLVSSKTNAIQVRDANDGLLLRTMANDLTGVSIYDMLIEGSTIYCGGDRKIFSIDFHSGALKKSRPCEGVAICVKLYKDQLIAACYNGNIYIFNTKSDGDAVNLCGPSNMLLAMDLWDDKIIAATKDKTLKIMSIQT